MKDIIGFFILQGLTVKRVLSVSKGIWDFPCVKGWPSEVVVNTFCILIWSGAYEVREWNVVIEVRMALIGQLEKLFGKD